MIFIYMAFVSLIFSSCMKGNQETRIFAEGNVNSTKEYIENNIYIDDNIETLINNFKNPEALNSENTAKMKAAVYRFYKNVSVENGLYVCNISKGEDINVSQEIFNALSSNLQEMNHLIQEAKEKGETIVISEPDEEYLNSLLK